MDSLQPGQMLGPYRLIEQIGQGGMATVYKAYQAAMDRYVALKVLPRQLADNPAFLGRFQQEARIIANLEHPHILPVHDYGESAGYTYLVMRYFDTGTLKERMSAHPLSLSEIDGYFSQLADALEYAHAHGVIHRDLKPSNVLVDARGNLFLTDFGIAKLLESSSQFTGTGALVGTPDYMSPEQAQGLKVDQRSDIYSLGIILYEMVTGQVPFCAETPLAVILMHLHNPLPLPSTLKPGLSPAIERVLLKALTKTPDDRFATTTEFHAAWKKALAETNPLTISSAVPPPSGPAASVTIAAPSGGSPTTREIPPVGATSTSGRTPTAGGAPPMEGVPSQAQPAGRKWPVVGVLGGVLILLLCGLVSLVGVIGALNMGLFSLAPATPTPTPVLPLPTPAGPPWKSWVGANHVWSLAIRGDEVAAGGRGLTLWKQSDGTLAGQFAGPAAGLPDVYVNAILVGDGGALWLGTAAGVGFYDGQKWTTYGPENGLDSPNVTALAWLPDGLLAGTQWSGTDGQGLNFFAPNGVQAVKGFPSVAGDAPGTLSPDVTALLTLPGQKTWWVGTQRGLARYDEASKEWTLYFQKDGLPGETINTLMADSDGAVWVGTNQGAAKFDGQRFEALDHLQGANVLGLVQDNAGRYWFSGEDGLQRFTPPQGNVPAKWDLFTQDNGLPSPSVYGAVKDAEGRLYFGSDAGLVRYDGQAFATWALPGVPAEASWGRILPAPEGGALWFTERYGCAHPDRLDLTTETWSPVALPAGCYALAVGTDRSVWVGGDEGLWILTADSRQVHLTTKEGLPSDQVVEVAFAPQAAWVATAGQGLALVTNGKVTRTYNTGNAGLTSNVIRALRAGVDSSMWVGTDKGLDHFTLSNGQWEHYPIGHPFGQGLEGIAAIAQTKDGALWVSTSGDGNALYRLADGAWQRFAEGDPGVKLPPDVVQSLAAAPDGSLWMGSYEHGAAHYDGKTWTLFGKAEGLVQLNVRDIWVEPNGVVWFATDGGVTRYSP